MDDFHLDLRAVELFPFVGINHHVGLIGLIIGTLKLRVTSGQTPISELVSDS